MSELTRDDFEPAPREGLWARLARWYDTPRIFYAAMLGFLGFLAGLLSVLGVLLAFLVGELPSLGDLLLPLVTALAAASSAGLLLRQRWGRVLGSCLLAAWPVYVGAKLLLVVGYEPTLVRIGVLLCAPFSAWDLSRAVVTRQEEEDQRTAEELRRAVLAYAEAVLARADAALERARSEGLEELEDDPSERDAPPQPRRDADP